MQQAKKIHIVETTKGIIFILLNTFLWGISPWVIKQGLKFVTPVEFLLYRFMIVSLFSLILYWKYIRYLKEIWKNKKLLFSAIGFNFITLLLYFYGLDLLTSVQAGILAGTSPLFVMIPMLLSKRERLVKYEKIGILSIILGYFVILAPSFTTGKINWLGVVLLLLGNAVFSGSVIINKKYLNHKIRASFELLSFVIAFFGFLIITIIEKHTLNVLAVINVKAMLSWPVLYMALGASFLAVQFFNLANLYLEASETTSFAYAQPLFLLLLEIFVLKVADLSFINILGILFMFFGTIINIIGIYKEHLADV